MTLYLTRKAKRMSDLSPGSMLFLCLVESHGLLFVQYIVSLYPSLIYWIEPVHSSPVFNFIYCSVLNQLPSGFAHHLKVHFYKSFPSASQADLSHGSCFSLPKSHFPICR